MRLRVDLTSFVNDVTEKLNDKEIMREIADAVSTKMYVRIFEDGKASDGSQIGTYNSRYLKLRQSKYGRSSDSMVIVSLTRSTENNWQIVETPKGWGIGILNAKDFDKFGYVEEHFSKTIGQLTEQEQQEAADAAAAAVQRKFSE